MDHAMFCIIILLHTFRVGVSLSSHLGQPLRAGPNTSDWTALSRRYHPDKVQKKNERSPVSLLTLTPSFVMSFDKFVLGVIALLAWTVYSYFLYPFYFSPFAKVPGSEIGGDDVLVDSVGGFRRTSGSNN